jgi:hypothetical protein
MELIQKMRIAYKTQLNCVEIALKRNSVLVEYETNHLNGVVFAYETLGIHFPTLHTLNYYGCEYTLKVDVK